MCAYKVFAAVLISMILVSGGCKTSAGVAALPNPASQASGQSTTAELKFKAPEGWIAEKPSSSMRMAQYKLPRVEGDPADANFVLYYFGSGQGGSVQENVDRWIAQMEQPGGATSKEKAKVETITVNGLKVTTVDVSGTYVAQMSPGSATLHNDTNQRLKAAVIETTRGNYFAKLVGPDKTVGRWAQSFDDYLRSIEFK